MLILALKQCRRHRKTLEIGRFAPGRRPSLDGTVEAPGARRPAVPVAHARGRPHWWVRGAPYDDSPPAGEPGRHQLTLGRDRVVPCRDSRRTTAPGGRWSHAPPSCRSVRPAVVVPGLVRAIAHTYRNCQKDSVGRRHHEEGPSTDTTLRCTPGPAVARYPADRPCRSAVGEAAAPGRQALLRGRRHRRTPPSPGCRHHRLAGSRSVVGSCPPPSPCSASTAWTAPTRSSRSTPARKSPHPEAVPGTGGQISESATGVSCCASQKSKDPLQSVLVHGSTHASAPTRRRVTDETDLVTVDHMSATAVADGPAPTFSSHPR